ncbi:relaxase/mobilization nuclease-like protein [Spirosoma oryzae]|uniref:Relaxase/mobilization nuclease-like protein n=1 Tax=Spirosoma oryzae TaxID=1469603 RepID=A0A2T0SNU9_9BACT|nr:relaxase/mobilization nuclease domain-containing protein [Spirosoma oryzae]PRY35056.1 relaxase/mobilization nuclease-like protein [Spirosoma oryzae]
MVARISSGASPSGAARYNENKVEKGEAERLAVRNFKGVVQPVGEMTYAVVAGKLEDQAGLNQRIGKPTFHASLSLAPGEKPSSAELLAMADQYMQGMGYGRQPYVVYQHHDTDHTHVHIVSVRVDDKGKKVPDNHERERSNKLRQQIEQDFGLQAAQRTAVKKERVELVPLQYGQGDLKRELSDVVQGVLRGFQFSSMAQYNQLLGIYNVKAIEVPQPGKAPGLVYSLLDSQKNTVGTPFAASTLPYQPTLSTVTRRADAGKKIKGDRVKGVRKVAYTALTGSANWTDFQVKLSAVGIETLPHRGADGNLFGISYVDVRSKAIYGGSELGKAYTAGSLKNTFGPDYTYPIDRPLDAGKTASIEHKQQQSKQLVDKPAQDQSVKQRESQDQNQSPMHNQDMIRQFLNALAGPEENDNEHELKSMLKRARQRNR